MPMLNIGLNNTGHLTADQARKIAFTMIGGSNIREHAVVEAEEPTFVVDLFCDNIHPGLVYRIAVALNQQAIAYYNEADDFGLLIGPRAEEWGHFDPTRFVLCDGTALAADPRA